MLDWLKSLTRPPQNAARGDSRMEAIAGLLADAAAHDGGISDAERQTITGVLARSFGLAPGAAQGALAAAEQRLQQSVDLHGFTRAINAEATPEERQRIVEALWEVILTDDEVHHYEAAMMRRLGGLLHVTDRDMGEARQRVAAQLARDKPAQ